MDGPACGAETVQLPAQTAARACIRQCPLTVCSSAWESIQHVAQHVGFSPDQKFRDELVIEIAEEIATLLSVK